MSFLELTGLSRRFGEAFSLSDVSLSVEQGECFGLLGPSGAGKTTLLRLIAGLEAPDEGRIVLDAETVWSPKGEVPAEKRRVGMVFQTLGLWAHLDALGHLDLVLRRRLPRAGERAGEARRLLALAHLEDKARRRPGQLSGGERQRLALVRALAPQPRLLLLDEPFAHVDEPLRDRLAEDLLGLINAFGATVLLVSHDGAHAAAICQSAAILNQGRLEQLATPREIHQSPATPTAARMTGPAFLLDGTANEGQAQTAIGAIPLRDASASGAGQVCLRPESFSANAAASAIQGRVTRSTYIAGRFRTNFRVGGMDFWTWETMQRTAGDDASFTLSPCAWVSLVTPK
jgi:iron(III) transport system ATP-binding protein